MTKKIILSLTVIFLFILSLLPRLYRLDNPVADWHSWRQADTAAVSRNFIKDGFTPLFPRFDALEALNENGQPNPNRYFFAEFPLYNILTYPFYLIFGVNEAYARFVSAIFASLTTVSLFFLIRIFTRTRVALVAAIFFALIPFNIYYGRVIMPDPLHVFLSVTALLFYAYYHKKNQHWFFILLAGLAYAGALLTKPYALVLLLPLTVITWQKYGFKAIKNWHLWSFLLISLLPLLAWRYHINQYPEGMFGTTWLFNSTNIRFTGAFWRWLIATRLNEVILGVGGFVLFIIGLLFNRQKKRFLVFYAWFAAMWIFFIIIATGNVTHDYYQLPILPSLCFFAALGFWEIVKLGEKIWQKIFYGLAASGLVAMMLAFSWYQVRGYFNVNHWAIYHAGQYADQNLPAEAKVIAPYAYDPSFLYQTNRYGWTIGGEIEEKIAAGATHYITTALNEEAQVLIEKYQVVVSNDEFTILDLRQVIDSESKP